MKKRRLISFVLAAAMAVSSLSLSAFAAGTGTTVPRIKHDITVDNSVTTLYVGGVSENSKSQLKYLYSDKSVSAEELDFIKKSGLLTDDYAALLPTTAGQIKANNGNITKMDYIWNKATNVAYMYFSSRAVTITDTSDKILYNTKPVTDAKQTVDAETKAKADYDKAYLERKAAWEAIPENNGKDYSGFEEYCPPVETRPELSLDYSFLNLDKINSSGPKYVMIDGRLQKITSVSINRKIFKIVNTSANFTSVVGTSKYPMYNNNIVNSYTVTPEVVTLYVGGVSEDGSSKIKYLYSDKSVTAGALTEIKKILPDDYAKLLPTKAGQIKAASAHGSDISADWKNAQTVAKKYFKGTVTDTSSTKLYNTTQYAALTKASADEVAAEKADETANKAAYDKRKAEWDDAEKAKTEKAEAEGKEYCGVDFPEEYVKAFNDTTEYPTEYLISDTQSEPKTTYILKNGQVTQVDTYTLGRTIVKVVSTSANVKTAVEWNAPTYSWSKDNKTCTATRTAKNDSTKKETETATATSKVKTAATCTAKGTTTYTATFKNSAFKTQTKDVKDIALKAHTKGTAVKENVVAATCTKEGSYDEVVYCKVCKKELSRTKKTIAKLAHNYKTTVVKPTCTTKGYTLHKCSVCGSSYKSNETAMTAHTKGTAVKEKVVAATCTKEGSYDEVVYCTVCKKELSRTKKTIAKATHKFSAWTTTKKATCTADGTQTRKCSVCGKTETKTIKATGHKYSSWTTTGFNVSKGTSTQKRTCSVCKKVETKTVNSAVKRYAGSDRFATAALISNKNKSGMYTTANTVILASGMTFNDALAAVPLAKAYNAPLLLSAQRYIPTDTLNEIKRLKAKEIIVVNTNGAISAAAINTLKKSYKVTQITGKTCYETASKVATSLQAKIKSNTKGKTTIPDSIFFVVDDKFADALSVSPVAAIKGAPIIYVKSTGNLNSSTTNYLKNLKGKIKNVYIVGGTVAISTAVENKIKSALGVKSTVRFAGSDRYETCTKINTYFKSILKTNAVCIAKGLDFPDALAGGVFAANNAVPLFLADYRLYDPQTKYLKGKTVNKIYIFGGEVAVPTKLAQTIATASV